MGRPRLSLPDSSEIRDLIDADGRLAVRVTPGARVEALQVLDGRLVAKVRVKAEGGKANEAVLTFVASALGVAPSRIELLRGATSREKMLRVSL